MRPEERLQIRCAMFCKSHLAPHVLWTALEHGRQHKGTETQRAAEWQRLARKGVRTGLPDLLYVVQGYVLGVELKTATGKQSDTQKAMQAAFEALAHGYVVARSVEQLGEALERHGIPLAAGWRVEAMRHDAALDSEPKPVRRVAKPRAPKATAGRLAKVARLRGKGLVF